MIREQTKRRKAGTISLGMVALWLSTATVRADVIDFTGNVGHDFPVSAGTTVIAGKPGSVAESPYMLKNGWTTGFLVQSLHLSYDKASDTLFVGVQTRSITGDADGNGDPGYTDPQMAARGGVNSPHFGGDKSLTIGFASSGLGGGLGTTQVVAGIPADKSKGDTRNTNKFTVATYHDTGRGLAYSYGTILDNHVGRLAVDPSASKPNFEFALTRFSQLPGFNPAKGFYISLFLGAQSAVVVGKEALDWVHIPGTIAQPGGISQDGTPINPPSPAGLTPLAVPEPGSIVLLAVGAIAAAATAGLVQARRRV